MGTNTNDIARIIYKMIEVHYKGRKLQGIFHWQSNECLTKYDMVQIIAELTGADASAVVADRSTPKFPRPEDTRLDRSRLVRELDIDPAEFETPFRDALRASMLPILSSSALVKSDNTLALRSSVPGGFAFYGLFVLNRSMKQTLSSV